jgi:deoxyribonuclease-4
MSDPQAQTRATRPLPLIGAQIKTAGGFRLVPERAAQIGAEVVQIFNSNARQWRPRPFDPDELETLKAGLADRGLPLFFHTIYLINLASPDEELRLHSSAALAEALFVWAVAGADGVVVHVGSHRGEGFDTAAGWVGLAVQYAQGLARERLAGLNLEASLPCLLLETSAGSANSMGRDLEQLAALLHSLPGECGLCLDTAHLFAAGYPIHEVDGLERFVEELRSRRLLDAIRLIHLNDSRTPFGSGRDHHENLGDGEIGCEALGRVLRHPAFRERSFVLEVPGLDGHGPDAVNLERAKTIRSATPSRP